MTFKEQRAKELIEQYNLFDSRNSSLIQRALEKMFDEAIDLAAENVNLLCKGGFGTLQSPDQKIISYKNRVEHEHYGHGDCTYQITIPNKQSILQLKTKEVK